MSTRWSRSISSAMAARTASIMRICEIQRIVARKEQCDWTRLVARMLLGKGGGNNLPGGTRDFVLGRGQERDGWASTSTALLSAERAARRLLRFAGPPAGQPAWPVGVLLAAPPRCGPQGREAGSRRRANGSEIPGRQDPQADVFLHRACLTRGSRRCVLSAAGAGRERCRV